MKPRPHEKLEVYTLAHDLAVRVHGMSFKLPRFEIYEEASQLRRSSKSVSAQIVEGHALRHYKADYVRYLSRAYGSAEETIEHLRYLIETESGKDVLAECDELLEQYGQLVRKLYNYTQAVREHHRTERAPKQSAE